MPRRKVLKVIVDVTLNAVTCPGVILPDQTNVFLNVDIFGENKRTECLPAVFPFLFHEKMRFEKTFHCCTDPVQVANALGADSVQVELVQMSYPEGELLACYQENARKFLFPTPRVSAAYPGVDREVLLNRSDTFPGIAPKLEFSSRTIIKEVNTRHGPRVRKDRLPANNYYAPNQPRRQQSAGDGGRKKRVELREPPPKAKGRQSRSLRRSSSPAKQQQQQQQQEQGDQDDDQQQQQQHGYRGSTICSRARSPSPYAKRRMSQLCDALQQSTLDVKSPFQPELDDRPQFVVRKADDILSKPSPPLQRRRGGRKSGNSPARRAGVKSGSGDKIKGNQQQQQQQHQQHQRGRNEGDLTLGTLERSFAYNNDDPRRSAAAASYGSILDENRSSLRERYYPSPSGLTTSAASGAADDAYTQIRERVRHLLITSPTHH